MDAQTEYKCFVNWRRMITTGRVASDQLDVRTNMYCRDDTQDASAYIDYITLCYNLRHHIKSGGIKVEGAKVRLSVSGPDYMFDLGFLPITMVPSYWRPDFANDTIRAMHKYGIQAFPRPAIGLATYTRDVQRTGAAHEWWVSKVDVGRVLGKDPLTVTLKEVLSLCG